MVQALLTQKVGFISDSQSKQSFFYTKHSPTDTLYETDVSVATVNSTHAAVAWWAVALFQWNCADCWAACPLFPGFKRGMCEAAYARVWPGAAEPHTEPAVSATRQNVLASRLPGNNTSSLHAAEPVCGAVHQEHWRCFLFGPFQRSVGLGSRPVLLSFHAQQSAGSKCRCALAETENRTLPDSLIGNLWTVARRR